MVEICCKKSLNSEGGDLKYHYYSLLEGNNDAVPKVLVFTTGDNIMECQRCQGLIVKDQLFDPDGPFLHIQILRCLNCGETVYPTTHNENGAQKSKTVKVKIS